MNRHQHVEPPSTSWTTIDMNHQHWRHQHESRDPRPLDLPTCSNRRIGMRPPRCLGVFQVAEDTDLRGKQFRYYESHAIHVWCIFTYIYLQHLVNLRWCVFFSVIFWGLGSHENHHETTISQQVHEVEGYFLEASQFAPENIWWTKRKVANVLKPSLAFRGFCCLNFGRVFPVKVAGKMICLVHRWDMDSFPRGYIWVNLFLLFPYDYQELLIHVVEPLILHSNKSLSVNTDPPSTVL